MISLPHLATTLIYYLSRRWRQYLNRCVVASDSKVVEALGGGSAPFSFKSMQVDLEVGRYIGPILPVSLDDLVAGKWSADGGEPKIGNGGSNNGVGDGSGGVGNGRFGDNIVPNSNSYSL